MSEMKQGLLYPTMETMVQIVGNRYLLVNVAAKRAREIAEAAMDGGYKLEDKPVSMAVREIYRNGMPEEN